MNQFSLNIKSDSQSISHFVGSDLSNILIEFIEEYFAKNLIYLITDSNLFELYSGKMLSDFQGLANFRKILKFPAGEASKTRQQKECLEDELLSNKAGRDTLLVALGGGVTGDLAGYVAATLHRGISLIHLPTSLLAMVDSSIGGKVGVNHAVGKNLIGAFYQPSAVFADISFLQSLPEVEFRNGIAEVIKYAVTLDDSLWDILENEKERILAKDPALLENIISRSMRLKIDVVESDEKESNFRSVLNFGHTLGHAVERLGNYKIKHGFAVALGMVAAAKLSSQLFAYPQERVDRLINLLADYELLQNSFNEFPLDDLWEVMQTDKKSRQQMPHFTLMERPGRPKLFYPVSRKDIERAIR